MSKTQQQRLRDIVKTNIAPIMKKNGFKRKGNWFNKKVEEYAGHLNVISSRWNDKDEVRFTLEMYIMEKDKRPVYDDKIKFARIGHLKSGRHFWYELTPKINQEKLGKEIESDISEYIIPFFNNYLK